jgi:hypothetical protein
VPKGPKSGRASLKTRKGRASLKNPQGTCPREKSLFQPIPWPVAQRGKNILATNNIKTDNFYQGMFQTLVTSPQRAQGLSLCRA